MRRAAAVEGLGEEFRLAAKRWPGAALPLCRSAALLLRPSRPHLHLNTACERPRPSVRPSTPNYNTAALEFGSHEARQRSPRRRPCSRECRFRASQPVPRHHDRRKWQVVSQRELRQPEFRVWVVEGWRRDEGGESGSECGGPTGVSDLLGGDGDVATAEPVGVLLYRTDI